MPKLTPYSELSEEEKRALRRQSIELADAEFQTEVAKRLRYQAPIDVSKARVHNTPDDAELTLGGFRVPEDQPPGDSYKANVDGKRFKIPIEPGTVNVVSSANMTPATWSHEYRHEQRPTLKERDNRLYDAYNAQTEEDWQWAVENWRDQRLRETGERPTKKEAEDRLLKEMAKQHHFGDRVRKREEHENPQIVPGEAQNIFGTLFGAKAPYNNARARMQYFARKLREAK